jgi:hypothetical protein
VVRVTRRSAALTLSGILLGGAVLSGCASQIDALAPVGGTNRIALRTAAIDVLLQDKLTIRDAPQCVKAGDGYSCVGSLTDGSAIVVTSPGTDLDTMTVMVGDVVVYDGSVQAVLDAAAQQSPPPEES